MEGETQKPLPAIRGRAFWAIFLMQIPFPIMWISVYKGPFLPLWAILYLCVVIVGRWKTTSYIPGTFFNARAAALTAAQERPWFWLVALFIFFGAMPLGTMMMDEQLPRSTVYLSGSVFGVFGFWCLIETVRKLKLCDPKFWS